LFDNDRIEKAAAHEARMLSPAEKEMLKPEIMANR